MEKTFRLPDLGEGIHEAEIVSILVKVGERVEEGDIIFEVETDKAVVEIPSPFTGVIAAIDVQAGDRVVVGDEMITFDLNGADANGVSTAQPAATSPPNDPPIAAAGSGHRVIPASPATRRLARELGVALEQVSPSGPEGLVTAQDVKRQAEAKQSPAAAAAVDKQATGQPARTKLETSSLSISVPDLPDFSRWGTVRREKMHSVRRATARQMALAWSQIPHVNSQDFADITQLEALRQEYKPKVEQKGAKLTLTVFALKAIATALKTYPRFNASLDPLAEEIILKEYYHIGVAVNTPDGLIVPVIKDVDRKSIVEIAVELTDRVERTRSRKVQREEMQGGTFTLTNAGSMGGGYFAPIINYPEVAIMGLGQARRQPVARQVSGADHEIVVRLMLPLILSIDHRVLDGADAIRFLLLVKTVLEDPRELMMTMI